MAFSKDKDERELQRQFYADYLPRVDSELDLSDILLDYSDGVINGNILEMKKNLRSVNESLYQAIKYLSARRISGKPVPANILIVSLRSKKVWLYKSEKYLDQIEVVYSGAASRNLGSFVAEAAEDTFVYSTQKGQSKLIHLLRTNNFTKINIDENCIVGWAETFYKAGSTFRKQDFLGYEDEKVSVVGEIRSPSVLSDYINPYMGKTNIKFNYLMDCLNDFLNKKDLGAFFTPEPYAKKASELVEKAIKRVPKGNDYVIIDRCAGTGILECALTDDQLSHCIVSTYEYFEYKVLSELIGSKVREIIPPSETEDTFMRGMVRGSDALSKEFVENSIITEYIDNPKCTIILFENPPFAETTSMEHQTRGAGTESSMWKKSWVVQQMKDEISSCSTIDSRASNEMGNAFIWSAFKYYLRQPTDSYVVFSPIKYWKVQGLISKKMLSGVAFNRKHFHARSNACIAVCLWGNEESNQETFSVPAYNLANEQLIYEGILKFEKLSSRYSQVYYDKRTLGDEAPSALTVAENGLPTTTQEVKISPITAPSIIGYLVADSSGFDNPDLHSCLLVAAKYNGHGFYLRKDNFIEKLPMFAAGRYIRYNSKWTERGRIMKSGDGCRKFQTDVMSGKLDDWLRKVLLFTCMEYQNHMYSLKGPDGHYYRNELCLDTTHGATAASRKISQWQKNASEKALIKAWKEVLLHAKQCSNYDETLTYGLYQIGKELNTSYKDPETGETIFDYPELNGAIKALKQLNRQYYLDEIVPNLFKYKFIK